MDLFKIVFSLAIFTIATAIFSTQASAKQCRVKKVEQQRSDVCVCLMIIDGVEKLVGTESYIAAKGSKKAPCARTCKEVLC